MFFRREELSNYADTGGKKPVEGDRLKVQGEQVLAGDMG
jgi:hypothetical protein